MNSVVTAEATIARAALRPLWITIAFAFALYLPVVVGSPGLTLLRLGAVGAVAALSVLGGYAVLPLLPHIRRQAGISVPFVIVTGFSLASVLHLAIVAVFHLDTGRALVADVASMVVLRWLSQRVGGRAPLSESGFQTDGLRGLWADLGVLLLASALVTFWTREALGAVLEARHTGILRVWNDFLLQATEISSIEHYNTLRGESPYLADTAQPFYHRASYALSAIFEWITRDGALETSTYFWLPVGMILMGMGAYGLGAAMGGRFAGLVAMAALFLLPDASSYGLRNGYFAFHWLIQVAPGAGYALGLVLMALALYSEGVRKRLFQPIAWGGALILLSALFRAHVALPAMGAYAIGAFFAWRPRRRWHRVGVGAAALVAAAIVMAGSELISLAPHLISGKRDVLLYIRAVHLATPTAYEGLYPHYLAEANSVVQAVLGYPLLVVAELGALVFVLPLLTYARWRSGAAYWPIDAVPYVVLLVHTAVTFLLPTPGNGDITEWSHRSFVLLYAVFAVMSAVWLYQLVISTDAYRLGVRESWKRYAPACLFALGLVTPWLAGKDAQYGTLRDGPGACQTEISGDLFAVTQFVRSHAEPGDRLQTSDADPVALSVALTGQQAYVSRLSLYMKMGGELAQRAATRAAQNRALAELRTYDELLAYGRQTGVRWYLMSTGDMPTWPTSVLGRAVFGSGPLRLFDLHRE